MILLTHQDILLTIKTLTTYRAQLQSVGLIQAFVKNGLRIPSMKNGLVQVHTTEHAKVKGVKYGEWKSAIINAFSRKCTYF